MNSCTECRVNYNRSQLVSAVKLNWSKDCTVNCYMSQFVSAMKMNWCTDCRGNYNRSHVECSETELV